MLKRYVLILFCVSLGFTGLAHAQAKASGGGSSAGHSELFLNAGALGIASGSTQLDVGPGFQFSPFSSFSWLQVGGEITYQKITYKGSGANNTVFMGGLTANLGPDIINCFFLSLGLAKRSGSSGVVDDTATAEPNGTGFFFFAGKRIPISGTISLRPSFGVISTGTTGMVFRPFAVSYLF